MHTEVVIHLMNAYVWCWSKICGSLDEILSLTMKVKFLINSNMTFAKSASKDRPKGATRF